MLYECSIFDTMYATTSLQNSKQFKMHMKANTTNPHSKRKKQMYKSMATYRIERTQDPKKLKYQLLEYFSEEYSNIIGAYDTIDELIEALSAYMLRLRRTKERLN